MLVGREGKPGSGKSYELVSVDLLEALRAGRKVYARINGLDRDAIAVHLGESRGRIDDLLVTLTDDQVRDCLVCDTVGDAFDFPALDKGALVIVDECHDFWPVGRNELPDRVTAFFAKHRHWGLDIALATQDFREVHRSVLRRLDKKNLYAKLDALGREGDYSVRYFVSPRPGSYEQIAVERKRYDAAVFPLYAGIQPGVGNAGAVYKAGTRTFWQAIRKWAILIAVMMLVGVALILRFFLDPSATVSDVAPHSAASQPVAVQGTSSPLIPPTAALPMPAKPKVPDRPKDAPGVAYIRALLADARPRLLGVIGSRTLVEFRQRDGDRVLERLTDQQLRALGFEVVETGYGLLAAAPDLEVVFTAWPVDPFFQQSVATTAQINAQPLVAPASTVVGGSPDAPMAPAASSAASAGYYGAMNSYGDMGVPAPSK